MTDQVEITAGQTSETSLAEARQELPVHTSSRSSLGLVMACDMLARRHCNDNLYPRRAGGYSDRAKHTHRPSERTEEEIN